MTKTLVAFGSLSGNTAQVADWVAEELAANGCRTTVVDCAGATPAGLCGDYDLVVFGCPTYGDDEIEIQEDFEPVLDALETTGIDGKKVAVFGCGDSLYTHFCGAVDRIEERTRECGGNLVVDSLKIDDPHSDSEDEIRAWARDLARKA